MASPSPPTDVRALFQAGRLALALSQEDLGKHLGRARRTVGRWESGPSRPAANEILWLVRRVVARDPKLAAELAEHAGQTLESLGLASAAPPALPPARLLVDSVLCAAAEALGATPASVRPGLRAAFTRARELGLSLADVEDGLSSTTSPPSPPAP